MNFFGSRIDVAAHIAGQLFKTPRDIDGIRKSNIEQAIAAFRTTPASLHVPAILFADLLEPFIYIHGPSMPHCSSGVNSAQLAGAMGTDPSVPEYRVGLSRAQTEKRFAEPIASRNFLSCSAAYLAATAGAASNEVINCQNNDRPDNRGDKTGRLARLVPTHCAPDPTREKRSSDTKQHRDYDPAGIAPWND